jgi:hypothetical protein
MSDDADRLIYECRPPYVHYMLRGEWVCQCGAELIDLVLIDMVLDWQILSLP